MSNVVRMPGKLSGELRKDCIFRNRPVQVVGENGELENHPCSHTDTKWFWLSRMR